MPTRPLRRRLLRLLAHLDRARCRPGRYLWRGGDGTTQAVRFALCVFALAVAAVSCVRRPAQVDAPLIIEQLQPEDGLVDINQDGGVVRRGIPPKPEPWQKKPPCDPESGEVAINGACYAELRKRPPCGRTLEHGGGCYRPVNEREREPSSIER